MVFSDLTNNHQLGKEFFRFSDLESLSPERYFNCLDLIKPLFEIQSFQNSTPGFYINYITNRVEEKDDGKNSLRLTYYTINAEKTYQEIQNFVKTNGKIVIYESTDTKIPNEKDPKNCDNEELKFRKFLVNYTQIALDLLDKYGRQQTQELVYIYRHYFLLNKISPEPIFGIILNAYSKFFRQLKTNSLDKQFLNDLVNNFGPGRGVGLHFLVNMMAVQELPYDPRFFEKDWFLSETSSGLQ